MTSTVNWLVQHSSLYKIPQVTIGRCAGNDDLEVIVFFPHAVREKQQIAKLTDEILTEWMDIVFLPALNDILPPVQSRTLPINHEMAKSQSLFCSQNLITASNESRRQYLAYRIQAEYLDDIWQQILRRSRDAPHSYSSAYGERARYKRCHLCFHVESVSVNGDRSGDVPMYTLKYLREVARKIMNIFLENENKVADYHEYSQYFLSGCGTMTIEPLPGSKLALHGLIFGQSYNTVKDVYAAGENYLASNRAVDDLGFDPTKIQALQSAAQAISDGQKSASAQALIIVFLYLSKYVDNLTSAGSGESFSTRDELRFRDNLWQVFDRLIFALEDRFGATVEQQPEHPEGPPEGLLIQRVSRPGTQLYRPGTNAVLRLQTSLFLNWVKWNVNRLAFGVCFIFSDTAPGEAITWEQARATATSYRAIAVFLGTTLPGIAYRYWEDRLSVMRQTLDGESFEPTNQSGPIPHFHRESFETSTVNRLIIPVEIFHGNLYTC
ncbi:hypothetical protein LTR10_024295 [Elasticomyces elasticus]|uniref:Uncharacterized protein n=1 Tax=Exophiala sideris TaxID=1016849 RepID=A0ABR0IUU1_9EURO|nr:hypothetical protein LTR10_024295 [Elasticomyces elasticus]KAK5020798.1 hypothetical protein LTS07_011422 [Exophiala sideris]KAK5022844.1 hypothetical protein LTR13_011397 [Exophiala sideris]KAK5048125.1 hypothetical protein LTR69_011437 [Exophiala sideris]KAK5176025.1 hypothetical protein LTR44_011420 [Eurotiomycetes sp. CCFEE 6388]